MDVTTMTLEDLLKADNTNSGTQQNQPAQPNYQQPNTLAGLLDNQPSNTQANQPDPNNAHPQGTPTGTQTQPQGQPGEGSGAPDKGAPVTELTQDQLFAINHLINSGKIEPWIDDQNNVVLPRTQAELDELYEQNQQFQREAIQKDIETSFYANKPPVWQTLFQYSQRGISDAKELIPLLSAIDSYETHVELDPAKPEDQEQIVRNGLRIQGLPQDAIETEITFLKDSSKLGERANFLKPVIDRVNEQNVARILHEKNLKDQEDRAMWENHYRQINDQILLRKDFDGVKISDNHKRSIALALIPDQKTGGLPIYNLLDDAIANGNWDVRAEIGLMLTDRQAHKQYFTSGVASNVSTGLRRELRNGQRRQLNNTADFQQQPQQQRQPQRQIASNDPNLPNWAQRR